MSADTLYQDVLLDHFHHPRNKGDLAGAAVIRRGSNPRCRRGWRPWPTSSMPSDRDDHRSLAQDPAVWSGQWRPGPPACRAAGRTRPWTHNDNTDSSPAVACPMSGLHDYQDQLNANQRAACAYIDRIARIVDAIEYALALGHDPRVCSYVAAIEAGKTVSADDCCHDCPARRAPAGSSVSTAGRRCC
jgi:hypothetical protein